MPLVDHPHGNYRFLPGIAPYSCGVVSSPGYELVHVTLDQPVDYTEGFDVIEAHLKAVSRPRATLCAIELRSPCPFTFDGFAEFNGIYANILRSWGLFVDGVNPIARTNIAPDVVAPAEPSLYAFTYSRPCEVNLPLTFVVAGAGELPEGILSHEAIIRVGDTSPDAIREKADFVMDLMEARLLGLGAKWPEVTAIDVYTIHSYDHLIRESILKRASTAAIHGVRWFYSRPPIKAIEFEMDMRGVRTELRLKAN
jgi:hypothetical protein